MNLSRQTPSILGGVVAVVGCDGAGKSRLAADLSARLGRERGAELAYLGQGSGNMLRALVGLPLVGPVLGRFLVARSRRAHAGGGAPASPDAPTAAVVHLLSRWRWHKFRRVLALNRRGVVVVTDRYPQADAPGFPFDGPGLTVGSAATRAVRWLARREQRLYRRMADHVPALLIRLNVDAETAHARKPDHAPATLRDKARVIPTLRFNGAPILDLDARAPYPQVLGAAVAAASAAVSPGYVPGLVALVGCDGSGKTRLAADLAAELGRERPTKRRYMGLISGEAGDRIKRLPLVGTVLERRLAARVRRAQDMRRRLPGATTAAVMFLFSRWRATRLRQVAGLARAGVLVIAERYPQAEVAGFHYDGPGLSADRSANPLVRRLAAREQALYEDMAGIRPALVLRLNVDPATAYARKPDHPLPELRDKSEVLSRLRYHGATVLEIDARRPYAQVLETALRAIRDRVIAPPGHDACAAQAAE